MNIEERIEDIVELVGDGDLYRYEASEKIIELLDKFAIGFAEWHMCEIINTETHLPSTEELLEIYKKGL